MEKQLHKLREELEKTIDLMDSKDIGNKEYMACSIKERIIDYIIENPALNVTFIPDRIERELYNIIFSLIEKILPAGIDEIIEKIAAGT